MKRNPSARPRAQWRAYRTATGARPVENFIADLTDADAAEIVAAMKEVRSLGPGVAAKHLAGTELWEIKVDGQNKSYRLVFATEGRFSHILLALVGFAKKTQKTPLGHLRTAKARLADWRARGLKST